MTLYCYGNMNNKDKGHRSACIATINVHMSTRRNGRAVQSERRAIPTIRRQTKGPLGETSPTLCASFRHPPRHMHVGDVSFYQAIPYLAVGSGNFATCRTRVYGEIGIETPSRNTPECMQIQFDGNPVGVECWLGSPRRRPRPGA